MERLNLIGLAAVIAMLVPLLLGAGPVPGVSPHKWDVAEGKVTYDEKARLTGEAPAPPGDLVFWYRQPARRWEPNALPIGNGYLGGMLFGGVQHERVQLNEHTLWSGSSKEGDTGAYQPLGDVLIDWDVAEAADYRRQLDLRDATHRVTYASGDATVTREAFCSYPARVMVLRYTATKPGSFTGTIRFNDAHGAPSIINGSNITSAGALANGLAYETQVNVAHEGGTLSADGATLKVTGADALTIIIGAATSYVADAARGFFGDPPHEAVTRIVRDAVATPSEQLKQAHVADYQNLFGRVALDVGPAPADAALLPTDRRLARYKQTPDDRGLEKLLFQHGRYLLIASSRPGTLPANLQGIWNVYKNPPWRSDYHANINVQMNYWPAETTGLGECHLPLFDYVQSMIGPRRERTAEQLKTTRSWAVRTENNIYGAGSFDWCLTANAWYAQHFWEHYAFTGDKDYLRTKAYPVLKEVCAFWEDRLKTMPDGTLVAPDGWSPEHGPHEDGVAFDQQLIHDLFTNTIEAADVLGVDKPLRDRIADLRAKLDGPKVGSWGQLLEWRTEMDDRYKNRKPDELHLDTPRDKHRHVSHLFAVYPGRQITVDTTPDWAKAAYVSLDARGDTSTGWSAAWKINLWARLRDGDRAHRLLQQVIRSYILPNGFGDHPPFQIDANFGTTAGVAEMLLQSHDAQLTLLPALPKAWPTGSVKGLRARGGYRVNLEWNAGELVRCEIVGPKDAKPKVNYGGKMIDVSRDSRFVMTGN